MPDILDVLSQIEAHLHQQDLYLKQSDERLGRQDRILELLSEQIRLMQLSLLKHGQLLDAMRDSVERVAQHSVRLAQMATEHTLLFERTMAIVERIERRLTP
jgi:hypothetical protein